MFRTFSLLVILACLSYKSTSQISTSKFGSGIQFLGEDSTYFMRAALRFQTLYTGQWRRDDTESSFKHVENGLLIRRARFKFDGWAGSPKLEYKFELSLSNTDQSGGNNEEFRNAPNIVLDATLEYKFTKGFAILFGQRKLPGNRERVISSGSLQLVDRSLLNSRYNIDRDVGIQFKTKHSFGGQVLMKEVLAVTQGDGRNVTAGSFGGLSYTFRTEVFPLGSFSHKEDYSGGAIYREPSPKLSIGLTYEVNKNAVRERGHLGSFLQGEDGTYFGKDMSTLFLDWMFKYKGWSVMGEYAYKNVTDDDPFVFDNNNTFVGRFFTGKGVNIMAGYNFHNNYEVTFRYTQIDPMVGVAEKEREYTIGLSKYIIGHNLKIQTDVVFRNTIGSNDLLLWRFQTDIHI